MPANPASLLHHLRRLAAPARLTLDADAALLGRFVRDRDEGAFAALVHRHGPMVLRVCRRVLADPGLADDAFQATFLVLARRAAAVRSREALASWLHGVAYRVARKARAAGARRRLHEVTAPDLDPLDPRPDPLAEVSARELLAVVDEEVQGLPEVYRLPVILCCLEGRTREEAAALLGWTAGAVKGRLERGRARLQARLVRRGLTLAAALAAVEVSRLAPAGALAEGTVRAAIAFAEGQAGASAGGVPRAALLAEDVLRGAVGSPLRPVAVLLVLGAGLAAGALALQGVGTAPPGTAPHPAPGQAAQDNDRPRPDEGKQARTDRFGDPVPDCTLFRLGTIRLRHGEGVNAVAFSPDGKTLLSASAQDHTIRLWELTTGREIRRFEGYSGRPYGALSLSRDGKLLAVPDGKAVRLWDMTTGRELRLLSADKDFVGSIALGADDTRLAVAGRDGISLWDVTTGERIRVFRSRAPLRVTSLAFSPAGKTVAAACFDDRAIRLWDVATGDERQQLTGHVAAVMALAFAPDGRTLASGSLSYPPLKDRIRLWDVLTGKELRQFGDEGGGVNAIAFSPDGKTLVEDTYPRPIRLWDVSTGKEVRRLGYEESRRCNIAFSPDGRMIATGGGSVRLWDATTGEEISPVFGHAGFLSDVAFSPDGRTVVTAGDDPAVHLWDAATGKEVRQCRGGEGPSVGAVAFSPDGRTLAAGEADGVIRLCDPATGREIRPLKGHTDSVAAVAFGPDGKTLVSAGGDGTIRLWDATTGQELRRFQGNDFSGVFRVALSPDGTTLATTSLTREVGPTPIQLWDVTTGKPLGRLEGHQMWVMSVAFSPDGRLLASGSDDATVRLWDRATLREVRRFEGQQGRNGAVAFSPDGRVLASVLATDQRSYPVCLREVATGREVGRFPGHLGPVQALAFSPDGRKLVSGSCDTTALIWDVTGGAWDRRARAGLSSAELEARWKDLAGDNAGKAYQAVWTLAAGPDKAVPFLASHIRPVAPVEPAHLARLLADLDSDRFADREKAARELDALDDAVVPALRQALSGRPSPEARKRLEQLLENRSVLSPEGLRSLRALSVLEQAGTPEARRLLRRLADGMPEARLTREAKASLERLARQPVTSP